MRAELLAYGGGLEALKKKYRLQTEVRGRGLKPKVEAIFARDEEAIRDAYIEDPAVEADAPIRWHEGEPPPPPEAPPVVQARLLVVAGNNSDWSDTGLIAEEGDLMVGRATGTVKYAWGSSATPGTAGTGGLDFRAGTAMVPADESWAAFVEAGPLKLRVRDNDHRDNKGEYRVHVTLIPRALLGRIDCTVVDADGLAEEDCSAP